MTDIDPVRSPLVQQEEVEFRSSVSEATFTRIGQQINFISTFQNSRHSFNLNGNYALGLGSTGPDGIFPCLFNMEIVGFAYYNLQGGVSGQTTIDLHWLSNGDTDNGSIWSVQPSVDFNAADNSYTIYDQANGATVVLPTGHTLGVLNKTTFDAGDAIRLDLDDAMAGANGFQFLFMYRPID